MRSPSAGRLALAGFLALALGTPAAACDVCAVYAATSARSERVGLHLGVGEQFTHFGTLRDDSEKVDNTAGQYLNSSVTQLFAGYNFTSRLGVQLTLPLIARSFRRPEGGKMQSGSENGPGDLSLTGHLVAFDFATERSVFRFTVLGGVKFPTGSPDRIGEELEEEPAAAGALHHEVGEHGPRHAAHDEATAGGVESGIHGHDLALGSGSYDGLVGGSLFWSYDRWFLTAGGQYAIRGRGAFDYRYANDLTWTGGPGYFVFLDHGTSVALQAVVSGETKGKDDLAGEPAGDTGVTAVYAGPGVSITWASRLAAEVAVDFPALQHNTALQLMPDVRARAGLTWSF